ncbi:MAG: GatB/YqeY domain-containing protein [Deltaproteobacteria bacterium]|nr:GatB/YqeY domain-containing protein [Deltaproteobacteria bacterium]
MSTIPERVSKDVVTAMKAGEKLRVSVLRSAKSEFNKAVLDSGKDLDEQAVIAILRREIKRREEAAEAYQGAGRTDLSDQETQEAAILSEYLPKQLGAGEIETIVREVIAETGAAGPRDFGKVMKPVMTKVAGRADGRAVKEVVDKVLASL